MESIGFVGLGVMGLPMARLLIAAGYDVHGHARSQASLARAAAAGIRASADLGDAVRDADIVITMLPDTPDVESVLLGPEGLLQGVAGTAVTVIDMSTIDPVRTSAIHDEAQSLGVDYLDAPVSGGEAAATSGDLIIMAGGRPEVVDRVRPILEHFGTLALVGGPGAGQTVKAANQVIVAGNIQVLSEALILLRRQGVDLEVATDVLGAGLAGSTVLTRKREALLRGQHAPGFRLALHHKDLGIAQRTARRVGVVMPVTATVSELVHSAVLRGRGDQDHSALIALTDELSTPQ